MRMVTVSGRLSVNEPRAISESSRGILRLALRCAWRDCWRNVRNGNAPGLQIEAARDRGGMAGRGKRRARAGNRISRKFRGPFLKVLHDE
jgi:hypothetical protein